MKIRSSMQFTYMLLLSIVATTNAMAQQQKLSPPANLTKAGTGNSTESVAYSYKLYNAPDNAIGYDIFKNGKPIFHQFVLTFITGEGKRSFATQSQVEKTAALAIGKIEKHMSPAITAEEIKKIAAE